ncbi:MAG: VanW family protein [Candidatus Portnoybacteria bacterium]|nr:VanW family protein [Candidatus Portnoybacteria bacterium]MDD4982824.1 VanW family protein [Candidatus Portnoybacteria bacterium]
MHIKLHRKFYKVFGLAALAALFIVCLSLSALAAANYEKAIAGLTVSGFRVGGTDKNKLKELLAAQIVEFNDQKFSLIYGGETWNLSPDDFGVKIDAGKTAAEALAAGRGPALTAMAEQIKTLFAGRDLPLAYFVNSPKFDSALDIFAKIETPVKNSSLKYDAQKNDFVVLPAQNGVVVDKEKLLADILTAFGKPTQNIYLSLTEQKASVSEKEMAQIVAQAVKIVDNAPYFLQSADSTWRIDKSNLTGWISAAPSSDNSEKALLTLDTEQISDFLIPLSASVNREPTDAKLTLENGELKFAILSRDGQKLNIETSAKKIADDILAGKKNIYLITDSVEPKISNFNTKELGLLTLIGKGESNFSGSPANRRINIKVGATKLNGFLIKPGEEFSFSQNIGDIDAPNGWVPELVIKNRQTIPEYGGGLCQISTTLFRAAINSGLKITERHPHAYPVHYYDPPGFDATVYPPNPDLKLLNDTPGHLLLQTKIEGNKLTFEIYGTNDGRQVKVKGPFATQKNPDGSLKATLTQEIWRDGQLERKQIFNSSYNSPALYPNPNATPAPSPAPSSSPSIPPAAN